jgi:hypothetical protein
MTPENNAPVMRPTTKMGNLSRQTDELSRSAEFRLQTEPDKEKAEIIPSSSQDAGVSEPLQIWCSASTSAALITRPVATRVAGNLTIKGSTRSRC